jgi:hypothetical protein
MKFFHIYFETKTTHPVSGRGESMNVKRTRKALNAAFKEVQRLPDWTQASLIRDRADRKREVARSAAPLACSQPPPTTRTVVE